MRKLKKSVLCVAINLVLVSLMACQSSQKKDAQQQIVSDDREKVLAVQLDRNMQKQFNAWNDPVVEQTLNGLLARLVVADPAFQKVASGSKVRLLGTKIPYVAAGLDKVVYISRGALSHVFYENELAVLLGTQLALIKDKAPAQNLANLQTQQFGENMMITLPTTPPSLQRDYLENGWFDAGGLFDYGHDIYLKAEAEGIRLAYAAKYDPRGSITLIQRWTTAPVANQTRAIGKILPEPEDRLKIAREEVAKLSPLRDPIVKTQAFEDLMSRIQIKKAKAKVKKH